MLDVSIYPFFPTANASQQTHFHFARSFTEMQTQRDKQRKADGVREQSSLTGIIINEPTTISTFCVFGVFMRVLRECSAHATPNMPMENGTVMVTE